MAHVFGVAELTRALKDVVESEFPVVWVRGQVTGLARPGSGHIYFSLKDAEATLNVVWFRGAQGAGGERVDPDTGEVFEVPPGTFLSDGIEALVAGRLTVYPPRGVYQLVAETVRAYGAGRLFLEFEALKKELLAKGWFDAGRKRVLPPHPERVAVVTAPNGAALRDFARVGGERGHGAVVRVYPTLVQGEAAPAGIAAAFERLARDAWAEVAVCIRGGGSIEDLWAFNTREVARAIYDCPVPVVSGVGHEVDVTIADLVADLRAATPSHAAQLLWPERAVLAQKVDDLAMDLDRAAARLAAEARRRLDGLARALGLLSPARRLGVLDHSFAALGRRLDLAVGIILRDGETRLFELARRLGRAFGPERLDRRGERLGELTGRLGAAAGRLPERGRAALSAAEARLSRAAAGLSARGEGALERLEIRLSGLDPLGPLARGYSLARVVRTGAFLRAAGEVRPGDKLDIMVYDGRVGAVVTGGEPDERNV